MRLPVRFSAAPLALLLLAPAILGLSEASGLPELPSAKANDNRVAAGTLRGNVLTVRLVVQMARWYPQASDGPSIDVETFAEEGHAPTIPGPLIRVPTGTIIEATIRNALPDSTITIHGFQTRPATTSDSIRLAPGETRMIRFAAGEPGKQFDPRTDHVYVAGWDGDGDPPNVLVNGDSLPAPVEMAFGTKHRLRFINIGVAVPVRFSIRRDTTFVTWKALAKDGADLPASQAIVRRAVQVVVVGETCDFEFDPPTRGTYTLAIESLAVPAGVKRWQRIDVR